MDGSCQQVEIQVRKGCAEQETCRWSDSVEQPADGGQEQAENEDCGFYAINGTRVEKLDAAFPRPAMAVRGSS
jgi:hypothetical protein